MPTAPVAILNATILSPETRVILGVGLEAPTPLPVDSINPESSNLFALLLKQRLVTDDQATFSRLRAGGWAALGPAIVASENVESFMNPALLEDLVGEALTDTSIPDNTAGTVLSNVEEYVPGDDWDALRHHHVHWREV